MSSASVLACNAGHPHFQGNAHAAVLLANLPYCCWLCPHSCPPPALLQVKCLMWQLLSGVAYLHEHWVLHRDLKTSNILYTNRCGAAQLLLVPGWVAEGGAERRRKSILHCSFCRLLDAWRGLFLLGRRREAERLCRSGLAATHANN